MLGALLIIPPKSHPLVCRVADGLDRAEVELSFFASLDLVEEKMSEPHVEDGYLGYIGPAVAVESEVDYSIYAFASATHTRVVALVDDQDVRDRWIKQTLKEVFGLYVDALTNPLIVDLDHATKFQQQLGRYVSPPAAP